MTSGLVFLTCVALNSLSFIFLSWLCFFLEFSDLFCELNFLLELNNSISFLKATLRQQILEVEKVIYKFSVLKDPEHKGKQDIILKLQLKAITLKQQNVFILLSKFSMERKNCICLKDSISPLTYCYHCNIIMRKTTS